MWTKNGKLVLAQMFKGTNVGTASELSNYKNTLGETIKPTSQHRIYGVASGTTYMTKSITGLTQSNQSNYIGFFQIYVGTGDSEPTENDYTLNSPLSLSSTITPTVSVEGDVGEVILAYTLINDTEAQQTIKEIGLCARIAPGNTTVTNCLLNRRLLASPVTMEPNAIYTFQYRINTSNLSE